MKKPGEPIDRDCEKCHHFCNSLNAVALSDKSGKFILWLLTAQLVIMKACEKNYELMSDAIVKILEGKESPED